MNVHRTFLDSVEYNGELHIFCTGGSTRRICRKVLDTLNDVVFHLKMDIYALSILVGIHLCGNGIKLRL